MNRNIDWGYPHFYDPVYVFFIQVRQSNIVAEKEREALVIILKIKGFPHSFWELVNKTKNAFIFAASLF